MEGVKFEKVSFGAFLKAVLNNSYLMESIDYKLIRIYSKEQQEKKDNDRIDFIKNIYNNIEIPTRQTKYSAGYDFINPFKYFVVPANKDVVFPSGIKVKLPKDENVCLKLYIRSSLGIRYGLSLSNGTGIIDSDFYNNISDEGNISLAIRNNDSHDYIIPPKCRMAQGIIEKFYLTEDDNTEGERIGGIGSTNK